MAAQGNTTFGQSKLVTENPHRVEGELDNLIAYSERITALMQGLVNGEAALVRASDADALGHDGLPYVVLPAGYSIHNLETLRKKRHYPRSRFESGHWSDYLVYVTEQAKNFATVDNTENGTGEMNQPGVMTLMAHENGQLANHVAGKTIRARTVFDAEGGHQHGLNTADYEALPTELFAALNSLASQASINQRDLINLCYDFPEQIRFFDAKGEAMTTAQAIEAFAKVSVESVKQAKREVADFEEEASVSEKMALKNSARMVSIMAIQDSVIQGLQATFDVAFRLSVRILKSGDEESMSLALRLQGKDMLLEQITDHMVREARGMTGVPVFRGKYVNG